ncbi:MAG: bifunctional diaminohydroxyphosphoribosylaminopyrimidine deaminase/5-amino-6-(5-phosphoribosylamino)uracil reductase RibD [Gammaproteobacteria bacterium]|nr:bifunctional diaminohydroxyphosphoribosylaminopyrimidine deaminase/5-amino-6-(5-phosphoribosylamino)uracil reductase RibD [Gammaproteobacteria bacterium]
MKVLHSTELDDYAIDWSLHLKRAIDLACNVISARPNPRVGCVIVKEGIVVAEGWHRGAGQPHAEVMALSNAQTDVCGATAFVSLEPCNHQGRTGPCSEVLINAGINTVVIAMTDPDPRVSGRGIKRLEQAGIKVFHLEDFEQTAHDINPGFMQRLSIGRPYVRMKLAMSLDGRTALANGTSKWITGTAARTDVQRYRTRSSAILTGINTVLADDPQLVVRREEINLSEEQLQENQVTLQSSPMRIVLDSRLRTPATAKILGQYDGKTLIYTCTADDRARFESFENVEICQVRHEHGEVAAGVNLVSVLESLATDYECNELLIEAGPTLCGSFLEANLVDELVIYMAPKLMGCDAMPLAALQGFVSLAEVPRFDVKELSQIDNDIKVVLRPFKV